MRAFYASVSNGWREGPVIKGFVGKKQDIDMKNFLQSSRAGYSARILASFFAGILALHLSGCATPASVEGMSVDNRDVVSAPADFPLKNTLAIGQVTGGEDTNPMWTSEVGNEDFRRALSASLRRGQLLSATETASLYRLNATLIDLQQPLVGFDIRVNSSVRYELLSRNRGERLWQETINAGYTATVNDAFMGVERLRLANEGSIRENIKKLIERLHRFPR